jgi:hypothetical protein
MPRLRQILRATKRGKLSDSANETMRQCETAEDWGRYTELLEYEASERRLSLLANDEAC